MARTALVVGGSIAGLFTALLLRQSGWDVHVTERAPSPLTARGAGIVTHPALWRALQQVGLDPHTGFGIHVDRRVTLGRDGAILAEAQVPQVMTSWDQVFRMLHAAWLHPARPHGASLHGASLQGASLQGASLQGVSLQGASPRGTSLQGAWPGERYTLGAELAGIDSSLTAHFVDGTTRTADLIVGADGIRSAVRTALLGPIPARYAGYTAWRGLVPEADLSPTAHAALAENFAFCLPPGEQMLGYPVAGSHPGHVAGPHNDLRPGHRRYNFVWYRPAAEATALPRLLTGRDGRRYEAAIPPPMIRPDIVSEMRAAADALLAPAFADVVRATAQPFLQPVYDLESPCIAKGRIALVGDSAFVARPHIGAGVTKAAEDAQALVEALDVTADIPEALHRYDALRRPAGERIVRRARDLGAHLQAERATAGERAAATRHDSHAAVMSETALLEF